MKPICLTANDYKRLAPYISNEFIRLNFIGFYTEKYSVVVEQHWFTAAKVYKILEVAKKIFDDCPRILNFAKNFEDCILLNRVEK